MLFNRRLKFAFVVLSSHLLLIALAITWFIQMFIISRNGSIKFVEYNPVILYSEIVLAGCIALFAALAFVMQLRRLGERRREDDTRCRRNSDK
jgi:hypothetical protein